MFNHYLRLNGILASDYTHISLRKPKTWSDFFYDSLSAASTGTVFDYPEYSLEFVRLHHSDEEIAMFSAVRLYEADRARAERNHYNRTNRETAKMLGQAIKENAPHAGTVVKQGAKLGLGYATGGMSTAAFAALDAAVKADIAAKPIALSEAIKKETASVVAPAAASDLKTPIKAEVPKIITAPEEVTLTEREKGAIDARVEDEVEDLTRKKGEDDVDYGFRQDALREKLREKYEKAALAKKKKETKK